MQDNETGRSLDVKMDRGLVNKLAKTRWFKSLPVYKHWKKNRSHKMRQLVLDQISFDISLALQGKKLQVYILKSDERGHFSEYVLKNGYEYAICVLEEVSKPREAACLVFNPYWMGAYETIEEALAVCEEMKWTLSKKGLIENENQ